MAPNWCRCVCLWRKNLLKTINQVKNVSSVDTALGWKNICALAFGSTAPRVVRLWAPYTVPSVAKYPHSLTWTPPPPPPRLNPPTLTDSTQTNVQHAWLHVCPLTHTYATRWVKCQVSHLMKRHLHTNRLCLCRERPFYSAGQCRCWLSFVCTFLSTKKKKKRSQRGMQS